MSGVLLFTGFPGFIGERLLPRILELQPQDRARCLVQEKFVAKARDSIKSLEARHPRLRGRIEAVTGDITAPRLGLPADAARALARDVTSAWHLAAVYDLAVPRALGMKVNVEGTLHVLELLSGARHLQRLHYVSTAYVSGRATGVFRETDLDVGQSFKNYYEETKYLAEVEVVRADLPRTIYRPGIVVGDSRTGETAKFDGPYFALAAMEKIPSPGVFFRIGSGRTTTNLVPVDFVVEAMARLSTHPKSRGRTYHLTDPEPLAVFEVQRLFARALGKSFAYVPLPTAVVKAMFAPRPLQRWLGMPVQTIDYYDHPCRHDASQATADLASFGLRCPRLPDYIPTLVAFYRAKRDEVRREAMV
jgi:thioester reductase-like protein